MKITVHLSTRVPHDEGTLWTAGADGHRSTVVPPYVPEWPPILYVADQAQPLNTTYTVARQAYGYAGEVARLVAQYPDRVVYRAHRRRWSWGRKRDAVVDYRRLGGLGLVPCALVLTPKARRR